MQEVNTSTGVTVSKTNMLPLFINMTHMAASIPKKVLGSSVEVQNASGLEECLPGVPGCRPCISLLI